MLSSTTTMESDFEWLRSCEGPKARFQCGFAAPSPATPAPQPQCLYRIIVFRTRTNTPVAVSAVGPVGARLGVLGTNCEGRARRDRSPISIEVVRQRGHDVVNGNRTPHLAHTRLRALLDLAGFASGFASRGEQGTRRCELQAEKSSTTSRLALLLLHLHLPSPTKRTTLLQTCLVPRALLASTSISPVPLYQKVRHPPLARISVLVGTGWSEADLRCALLHGFFAGRACLSCRKRRVRCDGEAPCRACKRTAHHEGRDESTIECHYVVKGSHTAPHSTTPSRSNSLPIASEGDKGTAPESIAAKLDLATTGAGALWSASSFNARTQADPIRVHSCAESFDFNNFLVANFISTGTLGPLRSSSVSSAASSSLDGYTSSLDSYSSSHDSYTAQFGSHASSRWTDSPLLDFNTGFQGFAASPDEMMADASSYFDNINLEPMATTVSPLSLSTIAPLEVSQHFCLPSITIAASNEPAYFDTMHHPQAPTTSLITSLPLPSPAALPTPVPYQASLFSALLSAPSPALPLETTTSATKATFSQVFDPFALDALPALTPGAVGLWDGLSTPGWSMDFSSWLTGPTAATVTTA